MEQTLKEQISSLIGQEVRFMTKNDTEATGTIDRMSGNQVVIAVVIVPGRPTCSLPYGLEEIAWVKKIEDE